MRANSFDLRHRFAWSQVSRYRCYWLISQFPFSRLHFSSWKVAEDWHYPTVPRDDHLQPKLSNFHNLTAPNADWPDSMETSHGKRNADSVLLSSMLENGWIDIIIPQYGSWQRLAYRRKVEPFRKLYPKRTTSSWRSSLGFWVSHLSMCKRENACNTRRFRHSKLHVRFILTIQQILSMTCYYIELFHC